MNKKQEILNCIKNNNRLSTSRVAGSVGIPFDYALKYLMELESENKVKRTDETNATYWEVN